MDLSKQAHVPAALTTGERAPTPSGKKAGWATESLWMQ